MDCEGCEFEIIKDEDFTYLKKARKLVIEYHESKNCRADKLESILEKAGFKVGIYPWKQMKNIGLLTAHV